MQANNLSAATITADSVSQSFEHSLNLARTIAASPDVIAAVQRRDEEGVRARLRTVVESYPLIDRAFVTDPTGLLWSDYPRAPESLGQSFSHRDWYRGLSRAWEPYISEVYQRHAEPKPLVVAIAVPMRGNQQVLGALVYQYRLDGITDWLKQVKVGTSGYVFLIDHTGTVAAHPTLNLQARRYPEFSELPPIQQALHGQLHTAEYLNPLTGQTMVASFIPVPAGKRLWAVIAEQPVDEAYAPIRRLRVQLSVGATILTLAALVVTGGLGRISERNRRLNRQLTEQNQRLQQLASSGESSDDAISGKTLDGTIRNWNAGAERMYGYVAGEIVGRPISILVPPRRPDEVPELLEKIIAGEGVEDYETVRVRKDGQEIHISLTISPIRDAAGNITGASSIARDITERKQAEEALRKAHDELQATNAELEAFTYSVSHDLRAPLRHIDGFTRILVEELGPALDPTARHYLERVQQGARHMGILVDDLLHLSRIGRQQLHTHGTSLHSLVDEVIRDVKPETEGREIEWRIGQLPSIECDPGFMRQVFTNLLSNAVKFTRTRQHAVIEIDQTTVDNQMMLFVRDNGVGFNMKYADKLFGVFQRLHRQEDFEGTGVGLATVQRIIHKHGGRIWAEAEPDRGATFYFTLGIPAESEAETSRAEGGDT